MSRERHIPESLEKSPVRAPARVLLYSQVHADLREGMIMKKLMLRIGISTGMILASAAIFQASVALSTPSASAMAAGGGCRYYEYSDMSARCVYAMIGGAAVAICFPCEGYPVP